MHRAVLFGMPNCGKSSLFNLLTGEHAYVGNRAGVTVKRQSGVMRLSHATSAGKMRFRPNKIFEHAVRETEILLSDLPGVRSLPPSSADEREAVRVLSEESPELVLFVCDATDFARQGSLLRELCLLLGQGDGARCRLLAVFNFCDGLKVFPSSLELTRILGVRSVAISARTRRGIGELRDTVSEMLFGTVSSTVSSMVSGTDSGRGGCAACGACGSGEQGLVRRIAGTAAWLGQYTLQKRGAEWKVDRVLLNPILGGLLFGALLAGMLWLSFGTVGNGLTDLFGRIFLAPIAELLRRATETVPVWLRELLVSGLWGGVGTVLEFLPRLSLLFFLQALLEESGLLARLSRLADRPLSHLGLRGDAAVPVLLGMGCTVPAILCTRAMKDADASRRCATCLPAVVCSARMPLCAVLADAIFGGHAWLICGLVYLIGVLCFLLLCGIFRLLDPTPSPDLHADPLPRLRIPSMRTVFSALGEELTHFLHRAGGVILICSAAVWVLSSFDPHLHYVGGTDVDESILACVAAGLSPLFRPIGLGDWRLIAALLSGIGAKEAALSTLGVLLGGTGGIAAAIGGAGILTTASALSFLVFYALYFPCVATLATLRAEGRGLRTVWIFPVLAYLFSFAVYRLHLLLVG